MSEFPHYDRYPADILADTRHLRLAEKGAYNDLLDTMWLQGGQLPNDPPFLGRIVQSSERNWRRMWPRLKGFFTVSEDGKWLTQKRMTKELEKARTRKAESSERRQTEAIGQNGPQRPKGPARPNEPAKMPVSSAPKSLVHARARVTNYHKNIKVFVEIGTPEWRAWQQLKPTPTIFSAEHHANGWWFPSEWPPGAEPQEQDVA